MSKFDASDLLKFENAQLQEDLIFYKSENIDFRARIRDLEDENRELKMKLEDILSRIDMKDNNGMITESQLGPHFPEELLKKNRIDAEAEK